MRSMMEQQDGCHIPTIKHPPQETGPTPRGKTRPLTSCISVRSLAGLFTLFEGMVDPSWALQFFVVALLV